MAIYIFRDESELYLQVTSFASLDEVTVRNFDNLVDVKNALTESRYITLLYLPTITDDARTRGQLVELCSVDPSHRIIAVTNGNSENSLYAYSIGVYFCHRIGVSPKELYYTCRNVESSQKTHQQLSHVMEYWRNYEQLASLGLMHGEFLHYSQNILGMVKIHAEHIQLITEDQQVLEQVQNIITKINAYFEQLSSLVSLAPHDMDKPVNLYSCLKNAFSRHGNRKKSILNLQCDPSIYLNGYNEKLLQQLLWVVFSEISSYAKLSEITVVVEAQGTYVYNVILPYFPIANSLSSTLQKDSLGALWAKSYLDSMGGKLDVIKRDDHQLTLIRLVSLP